MRPRRKALSCSGVHSVACSISKYDRGLSGGGTCSGLIGCGEGDGCLDIVCGASLCSTSWAAVSAAECAIASTVAAAGPAPPKDVVIVVYNIDAGCVIQLHSLTLCQSDAPTLWHVAYLGWVVLGVCLASVV